MNNILVIAQGLVAKRFIEIVTSRQIADLRYVVVFDKEYEFENKKSNNVYFVTVDATSFLRLRTIYNKEKFLSVFILMEQMDEAKEIYLNIRRIDKKVRIILLDQNKSFFFIEDPFLHIVDAVELLANRIYDHLPNVPVVAQTIGLNQGEIMEVVVPFGSAYAFRHVGSIPQVKWKIAAIYRNNKLLLPTNATMIHPRDKLLIIGRPQVLLNVFYKIRNKNAVFPEPYGKNFYLYLDLNCDGAKALDYLKDALYLLNKFKDKKLFVRVIHPNNLTLLEKIKQFESEKITLFISYVKEEEFYLSDALTHDIGLIMLSFDVFKQKEVAKKLHDTQKLLYLFGKESMKNLKEAIITKSNQQEIEEISSVAFFVAEALKIKLKFVDFNPKGEFEESKAIIEHLQTLSHVNNYNITIEQAILNPIRTLRNKKNCLLFVPFQRDISIGSLWSYFSKDIKSLLLQIPNHPKLLIPIED